ncbi:MAG: hypothetical protein JWQ09_2764 [Segetibacter sp.]|nr:hypothetical protein [Segetibacter sp.]
MIPALIFIARLNVHTIYFSDTSISTGRHHRCVALRSSANQQAALVFIAKRF